MAAIPSFLLRHTATIEPYEGSGPYGDAFGDPVEVRCFRDDKRRLVRDPAGNQLLSETTLYARLDTVAPVGSRVTHPDGSIATVMQALRRDGGGLPTPDHLEIILT